MGGKAESGPIAAVVALDALSAHVAALEAQVRTVTAQLDHTRQAHHLVGHEVRTPLTVVLGVLSTLEQPAVTEVERQRLQARALAHARRLREVVDELLAGDAPPRVPLVRAELEVVRLAPLLRAACRIDPVVRPAFDVDETQSLATAPIRLRALVASLADHAARTAPGRLAVVARGSDHEMTITVADGGPGLGGRDPEELFEPRRRRTDADAPDQRGAGLYMARTLTRSLGGDLTLRDGEGGGLVATVTLPQRRSDDPPMHGPAPAPTLRAGPAGRAGARGVGTATRR